MTVHDLAHVYQGLKDFQRASVEHAATQLFTPGGTGRFLVADEVGLGKTLVARGVIAKALEHHVDKGTGRIDIVYVCSNGGIARQNIRRLNVIRGEDFSHATRLTLLPRQLKHLQGKRLNFVSFTPGTSFNLRSTEGIMDERALIHNMLRELWGDAVMWGKPAEHVFAGAASFTRFRGFVADPRNQIYDLGLLAAFGRELDESTNGTSQLQEEFGALREIFSGLRRKDASHMDWEIRQRRGRFVGALREMLAHACVDALEPDLVILDEFQRFKHLFDPEDPAGALARTLFNYDDVAVLLLSATPYKMYTHGDEQGEDHYADFLHTASFLLGHDTVVVDQLSRDIAEFRRCLFQLDADSMARAREARHAIEATLRKVMSRNERLAATENRSGMLEQKASPALSLTADDVRGYVQMERLGEKVDAHGASAYWEATPYPLTFMQEYQFTKRFEREVERDPTLGKLDLSRLAIDFESVERYRKTDPGNARMRSLEADVIDKGLWRLLWLPPSLPYHQLGGAFAETGVEGATKRLVFSAWAVVPNAVSTYLTYEAERRMMTLGSGAFDEVAGQPLPNTAEGRKGFTPRLNFTISQGRLSGMPLMALLYPSVVLAAVGDPLEVARGLGALRVPTLSEVFDVVRGRIDGLLAPLVREAPVEGRVDQRWYWAAPYLLDHADEVEGLEEWLASEVTDVAMRLGFGAQPDGEQTNLSNHLDEAIALLRRELEPLGRPPTDLAEVLAEFAMAGPAVCAVRAVQRVTGLPIGGASVRRAAASVAWGVRSLFNDQSITEMVSAESGGHTAEDAYWRLVLRYCLEGGLQSVFDEWTHVLVDSLQLGGRDENEVLTELNRAMRTALMTQSVNYRVTRVEQDGRGPITLSKENMRAAFARRFGDGRAETDQSLQTSANVRVAFNSPFWPFVLATTSVGQEGLDFHTYCHAVVHWNLPSNPVDMEQREGRVHRYKGHAVRRNVAMVHRAEGIMSDGDPWEAMFDEAARHRADGADELVPYWVFAPEGGAKIERYVPALPLSREAGRMEELRKTTAAYRLVFGQPRQEDLIKFLDDRTDGLDLDTLKIDLRPLPALGVVPDELLVDLRMLGGIERDDRATFLLDDDDEYEAWLSTAGPTAHVINADRKPSAAYLTLHRASCWTVSGTTFKGSTWTHGSSSKVVGHSAEALVAWAIDEVGSGPTPCGTCRPAVPTPTPESVAGRHKMLTEHELAVLHRRLWESATTNTDGRGWRLHQAGIKSLLKEFGVTVASGAGPHGPFRKDALRRLTADGLIERLGGGESTRTRSLWVRNPGEPS